MAAFYQKIVMRIWQRITHSLLKRRHWRHLGQRSEFGDYELMEYTDKQGNKHTEYRDIF